MPGVGAIWMAPALRTGIDKLRFVTHDIGGGFGNKICLHPQYVVLCLLARKLGRPVQWTEWRTDQHTANAHGNERWFLDVEVGVMADGTMTGFKVKALDDCGAFPRYEPLGCIIWAQVTPGMYGWRNIRVDFTQVCTNKSPVSPNRGYSRMQHLWLTERIIDIVATELDLDPVEIRKTNYVKAEQMPYETPNGCFYDSGDYAAALDIALDLIDHGLDRGAARGGGSAREAPRARHRLDARLGDEQLRAVDAPEPRAAVLGEQRGRVGEARHLRRGRRHARHRPAGAGPRDDGGAGRRRHPRLLARPGERAARPRHVVQLARRLLGDVREPVRVHGPRRREGRCRARARGDDPARGGRPAGACRGDRARPRDSRASRTGPPEAALPFMALGAIVNANNAFLPPDFNPTLNHRYVCRPYFGMVDTEKKTGQLTLTYATQIHAAVVEIDPETGEVDVVDYAAVDDCGVRINPQIVEGQVHGATAHAIGAALHEDFVYDEDGTLLTANFYDYHVPHALDMPPLKTGAMESPSPVAPLGAKGMGEGGGGGIHCICSAIQDALRAAGGAIVYDSCNPAHRVWSMLQDPEATRANVSVTSK